MQNSIPEEWRTHDRVRHISPIGNVLNEINLKKIECPRCGKQTLIDLEVDRDDGDFPIYLVVCQSCDWHAPEETKSADCGDAIAMFKEWLEAFYLCGCPDDLTFDYSVFFDDVEPSQQTKFIRSRTIPSKYMETEKGERKTSPIGRLLEKIPSDKMRCPVCGRQGMLCTKDCSNYKKSPLPLSLISCCNCGWALPSGISRSPECAAADLRVWMEAWSLLGCQMSMVNEDVGKRLRPAKKQLRTHKVTFPCMIGDTVYLPERDDLGGIICYDIIKIGVNKFGPFFVVDDEDQEELPIDDIGKDVFLTEEEAAAHCQE